jgi:hypothetical protein
VLVPVEALSRTALAETVSPFSLCALFAFFWFLISAVSWRLMALSRLIFAAVGTLGFVHSGFVYFSSSFCSFFSSHFLYSL